MFSYKLSYLYTIPIFQIKHINELVNELGPEPEDESECGENEKDWEDLDNSDNDEENEMDEK